jgi:hypothetical protein
MARLLALTLVGILGLGTGLSALADWAAGGDHLSMKEHVIAGVGIVSQLAFIDEAGRREFEWFEFRDALTTLCFAPEGSGRFERLPRNEGATALLLVNQAELVSVAILEPSDGRIDADMVGIRVIPCPQSPQ